MKNSQLNQSESAKFHLSITSVLQPLIDANVLSKSQLLASLELQSLGLLNLVNQTWFANRSKSYYTREFFEQQKFNLLREENEGFAKLLAEINQENLKLQNCLTVEQNIQKLIGYFSLDPNRVLELLLCAYQFNLKNPAYLVLLQKFGNQHTIAQLLGFRARSASADSQSLFNLIAMLIKHGRVDLTEIWSHLDWPAQKPETDGTEDEIERLLAR